MATQSEIDPHLQTQPLFKRAEDHKTIYSNIVRTAITPFDVRMIFSQSADPQVVGDQRNEDLATVVMAPEEAKAILPLIESAVKLYEETYGEIRDMTSVLEKMRREALAKAAQTAASAEAPAEAPSKAGTSRKTKKN